MVSANTLELLPPGEEQCERRVPLGPGIIVGPQGPTMASFPLQRVAVRARITGAVAAVEVFQTFTNPYSEPIEAVYVFPLPATAAVCRFRLQTAGKMLEGQVQEREAARKTYQKAQRAGFLSALLERERDNVFTVSLGALRPGEQVSVELAYAELVSALGPDLQFRFPLLVSPTLQPGATLDAEDRSEPTLAPGLAGGSALVLQVHLETGGLLPQRIACSQPAVCQRLQTNDLTVELARGELQPRDFVLSYRTAGERGPQSALRLGQRHFLLSLYPPASRPAGGQPRDLVILLDASDNAHGGRINCAKTIIAGLLKSLGPSERFALVGFNHDLTGYRQGIFCGAEEVAQGLDWLARLQPTGPADMKLLLERVLTIGPEEGRALSVLLITSGHVGNEPELYQMLVDSSSPGRFFTVGIDSNVNQAFLRRMAGFTRGSSHLLNLDENPEVVAARLVEDTRQPLISDLQLVDQGLGLDPESLSPGVLPGLTGARPLLMLGQKSANGALELRGRTFTGHAWNEAVAPVACNNPVLGVVWAQQRIIELQDELRLSGGPRASKMRQNLINLSQEYRLLTDTTAFVLVDTQATAQSGQARGVVQPSILTADWREESQAEAAAAAAADRPRPDRRSMMGGGNKGAEATDDAGPSEEAPRIRAGLIRSGFGGKESKVSLKQAPSGKEAPALKLKGGSLKTGSLKAEGKPRLGGAGGADGGKPMLRRGDSHLPRPGQPAPPAAHSAVATEEEEVEVAAQAPEPPPYPTAAPEPEPEPAPPPPPPADNVNHEQVARDLLKSNEEFRAALMNEMRYFFQVLVRAAGGTPEPNIPAYLQRILQRVASLAPHSVILKEVYRVGILCHQSITAGEPQAIQRTQQWVQKFATLFQQQ